MKYLDISEVRKIQIDHNSTCNLRCPQCARTVDGGENPDLPLEELQVSDYERMFDGLQKQLDSVVWCGNYGEVIFSPTFMDCISYVRNSGYNGNIIINTNASARNKQWWIDLAKIIGKNGQVNFSIDGLADTNHLYRVNANWDKIIENAEAFIGAGGRARWDYLVFEHNAHQIEEAKMLAKKIGFKKMQIKRTNRFVNDTQYQGLKKDVDTKEKVQTRKNSWEIEASKKEDRSLSQHELIIQKFGSWQNYLDVTNISCRWKPIGQIFVDFQARVWSCTWTASGIYHHGEKNTQRVQARKVLDRYGWDFNNLRKHSFKDILNHEYFGRDFCNSWKGKTTDDVPKLIACGRTCGTDYVFSSIHGKNSTMVDFTKEVTSVS